VKLDKLGRPIPMYVVDKETGKPRIDPATGKPMKARKPKPLSDGETEYEYDEKTGQIKLDKKTGQPVPKYVLDPKTGKPAIDEKTGQPLVMRRGKNKDGKHGDPSGEGGARRGGAGGGDSDDSANERYEIDW
jgi:hypothetical protein